jgi:hypothetical protein
LICTSRALCATAGWQARDRHRGDEHREVKARDHTPLPGVSLRRFLQLSGIFVPRCAFSMLLRKLMRLLALINLMTRLLCLRQLAKFAAFAFAHFGAQTALKNISIAISNPAFVFNPNHARLEFFPSNSKSSAEPRRKSGTRKLRRTRPVTRMR